MLATFWFVVLYQPLFNALIYIYSTIANYNLGWAVIWLTIFLRIILLPLDVLAAQAADRRDKAHAEAREAMKAYKNDPVAQKQVAREIMRKHHISPWAKALMLGIQLLTLILLYQVFIGGITGDRVLKVLYPGVDYPGRINTSFYGFEIGRWHDPLWAGIAAVYLFLSTFIEMRERKVWERADLLFLLAFPLFTYIVLWYLPMVKSLFILTTMIFSDIVIIIRHLLFSPKIEDEKQDRLKLNPKS